MPLKLKQERAGVGFELRLTIRRQNQFVEQLGVKESRIRLARIRPIPRLLRKGWNRDQLPHLETHLEIFGNLVQVAPELIGRGRAVERRIVPHGPEQRFALVLILAILSQALPRKRALGVLPLIDLALPAFVGPGGGTEAD